ncbi:uncharacterized protein LOC111983208 [Quercus suber]|uniref:uncharacterized protein LOC111983208 n=1 Tax=Quercus suber TaxID=58331 RepID=UPI0032DFC503
MALQIGKVAVLLGAGIVGSILAQEGRMPTVSDFVSGAFKGSQRQVRHLPRCLGDARHHQGTSMDLRGGTFGEVLAFRA